MKCEICKNKIDVTFLNKILGTHARDSKGKKHTFCSRCQKLHDNDVAKMISAIGKKASAK